MNAGALRVIAARETVTVVVKLHGDCRTAHDSPVLRVMDTKMQRGADIRHTASAPQA